MYNTSIINDFAQYFKQKSERTILMKGKRREIFPVVGLLLVLHYAIIIR